MIGGAVGAAKAKEVIEECGRKKVETFEVTYCISPTHVKARRGDWMRREECNWKKHCASHECEICQEGSEFRISVKSVRRGTSTTVAART